MILALVLSLAVGQTVDRDAPRLRWGVSGAGAAGVSFSTRAVAAGAGLSAEVGSTVNDSLAIVARTTLCTVVMFSIASLGASLEWTPADHWSLGAGVAVNGLLGGIDLPSAFGVAVPVRLMFSPAARADDQRQRRGLSLWVELAPGVHLGGSAGHVIAGSFVPGPPYVMTGAIGIGYAVW